MTTMKAAVFYDVKDLRVVDVPKATAGDYGVLTKVKAVGTSLPSLPQSAAMVVGSEVLMPRPIFRVMILSFRNEISIPTSVPYREPVFSEPIRSI